MKNRPSVSKTKYHQNETLSFDFPAAKVEDINIIKSLNPRKAIGPDGIPIKILKIPRMSLIHTQKKKHKRKQIFRRY